MDVVVYEQYRAGATATFRAMPAPDDQVGLVVGLSGGKVLYAVDQPVSAYIELLSAGVTSLQLARCAGTERSTPGESSEPPEGIILAPTSPAS